MTTTALRSPVPVGLAAPAVILVGLAALIAGQAGVLPLPLPQSGATAAVAVSRTVTIAPRPYSYRASGAFQQAGAVVDGPRVAVNAPVPLEIMANLVSAADYARCVADGACTPAAPRRHGSGDIPVTGVSYNDAADYARWLSAATGETWRLPTVAEWNFAAGSRAVDIAVNVPGDAADPAARWLATYQQLAASDRDGPAPPQPLGSFGVNEFGVADMSGNVWEWTSTCDGRTTLSAAGAITATRDSCGVRILEGRHRMPMSAFIRDGRTGGCSVGLPPDNLGFRLVRERPWYAGLLEGLGRLISIR